MILDDQPTMSRAELAKAMAIPIMGHVVILIIAVLAVVFG